MQEKALHIAVIGGGIAGLATASALLRRGAGRVWLFETQPALGTQSSGRSAAIWLPTESIDDAPAWSLRSAELLDGYFQGRAWLRRTGAYKLAPTQSELQSHFEAAKASGCTPRWLSQAQIDARFDWLPPARRASAFFVPEAGVMDTEAMIARLAQDAIERGLQLQLGRAILGIHPGQTRRWRLDAEGSELDEFDWVVDASGAWGAKLFAPLGFQATIRPLRRHILRFDACLGAQASDAIVWGESPEFYVRPGQGEQHFASPCDVDEVEPGCTALRPEALGLLRERVGPTSAAPAKIWSGTRNHSQDGRILKGPVPGAEGLAWLLGLAGRGMTVGVGVADAGAQAILERL